MRQTVANVLLHYLKIPLVFATLPAALYPATTQGPINLYYTPVDLVRQSEVVLRLQIGPPGQNGRLPVRVAGTAVAWRRCPPVGSLGVRQRIPPRGKKPAPDGRFRLVSP